MVQKKVLRIEITNRFYNTDLLTTTIPSQENAPIEIIKRKYFSSRNSLIEYYNNQYVLIYEDC